MDALLAYGAVVGALGMLALFLMCIYEQTRND